MIPKMTIFFLSGFNRYMVECEYSSAIVTLSFPVVLIDTWWNVNAFPALLPPAVC